MAPKEPRGREQIGRIGEPGLFLVSDRTRSWESESVRRKGAQAERSVGAACAVETETPVTPSWLGRSQSRLMPWMRKKYKLMLGEGYVRSALDVRFQPSCRQVAARKDRR